MATGLSPENYDVIEVTPEQAEAWLTSNDFNRQRPLRENHALTLAMEMEAGNFVPHSSVVFARVGDKRFLLDGQHRLYAVYLYGGPVKMPVLELPADSLETAAKWYGNIDQGLKRTQRDALRAQSLHDSVSLSERQTWRVAAAVKKIITGFTEGGKGYERRWADKSHSVVNELVVEWAPEAREYYGAIKGCERVDMPLFERAGVMACGLLTLRYNKDKALEFWKGMAEDNRLSKDDPRKKYLVWLRSQHRAKPANAARAFNVAWRAFLKGRPLQLLRPNKLTRVTIAEVPLDQIVRGRESSVEKLSQMKDLQQELKELRMSVQPQDKAGTEQAQVGS